MTRVFSAAWARISTSRRSSSRSRHISSIPRSAPPSSRIFTSNRSHKVSSSRGRRQPRHQASQAFKLRREHLEMSKLRSRVASSGVIRTRVPSNSSYLPLSIYATLHDHQLLCYFATYRGVFHRRMVDIVTNTPYDHVHIFVVQLLTMLFKGTQDVLNFGLWLISILSMFYAFL
jgi:hypothetical protein